MAIIKKCLIPNTRKLINFTTNLQINNTFCSVILTLHLKATTLFFHFYYRPNCNTVINQNKLMPWTHLYHMLRSHMPYKSCVLFEGRIKRKKILQHRNL